MKIKKFKYKVRTDELIDEINLKFPFKNLNSMKVSEINDIYEYFIEKMKIAFRAFYEKMKMPEDQVNEQMQKFNDAGKGTVWTLIESYGFAIIIDAIFAVIASGHCRQALRCASTLSD